MSIVINREIRNKSLFGSALLNLIIFGSVRHVKELLFHVKIGYIVELLISQLMFLDSRMYPASPQN